MAQKLSLGKGLGALLPGAPPPPFIQKPGDILVEQHLMSQAAGAQELGASRDRVPAITFANISDIQVNYYQPRKEFNDESLIELSDSIKISGIIQPLIVRREARGYQLIAGERRLRAARLAGLTQVPVVVRKTTDKEALELALVENIQREDLNPVDEALAYHQLMEEFGLTQEEVAKRVGKDRATVANHIRILKLPDRVIGLLKSRDLTVGHAKAIMSIEDIQTKLDFVDRILTERMSVRQTELMVEEHKNPVLQDSDKMQEKPQGASLVSPIKERLKNLAQEISKQTGSRIEIKGNQRRGKIILNYSSPAELETLVKYFEN